MSASHTVTVEYKYTGLKELKDDLKLVESYHESCEKALFSFNKQLVANTTSARLYAQGLSKVNSTLDGLHSRLSKGGSLFTRHGVNAVTASSRIDKLSKSYQELASAMGEIPELKSTGQSKSGGNRGTSNQTSSSSTEDPFERLKRIRDEAYAKRFNAMRNGSTDEFRYWDHQYNKANKKYYQELGVKPGPPPKQPKEKSYEDLVMEMVMSSRVGGKFMPLINRIAPIGAKMFGMESGAAFVKAAAPFALAGAVIAAGAAVFYKAAETAMNVMRTVGGLSGTSGAAKAGTAYWMAVGAGINPSMIGSADSGIHSPGTPGWYWAQRAGVNPYRNSYTGQGFDDAGNFIKELRFILLRTDLKPGQRKAAAESFGLGGIEWMYQADKMSKQIYLFASQFSTSASSIKEAASAQLQWNTTMMVSQQIMSNIGLMVLPDLNRGLLTVNAAFIGLNRALNFIPDSINAVADKFGNKNQSSSTMPSEANKPRFSYTEAALFSNPLYHSAKIAFEEAKYLLNAGMKSLGFGGDEAKKTNSIDKNTKAIEENTKALTNGTFGGGDKLRNAIGSGMVPMGVPAERLDAIQSLVQQQRLIFGML